MCVVCVSQVCAGKVKKGFRCCVGLAEIIWEACVFLYPTTNFFFSLSLASFCNGSHKE